MVFKICIVIIYIASIKSCSCQRRITHGRFSPNGKKFMVYLINSNYSDVQPDSWLCGGALISEKHILTSAVCLTEVNYIYAIAGYKKYVNAKDIDNDECTKTKKQRIVEFIIPAGLKKHGSVDADIWMKVDVGVAVVEHPYDFTDHSYRLVCSYEPAKISINYNKLYEEPNTVAVVYGWGGTKARKPGEKGDINSRYLREARTVITNTSFCANYVGRELKPIVNKSLICAFGSGYLSSGGKEKKSEDTLDGCKWRRFNLNESDYVECHEDYELLFRNRNNRNMDSQEFIPVTKRDNDDRNYDAGGICENDHGGPLVTWVGASEMIIGVALTSIYNIKYECQGPFLYVGTARSGSLIQCLLAQSDETRALCQQLDHNVQNVKVHWPGSVVEHTTKSLKPRRRHQMSITKITKMTQRPHKYETDYNPSYNRDARARIRPQKEMSREFG